MSCSVRRLATVLLLFAGLSRPASAGPATPVENHDPAVLPRASANAETPWIDLGSAPIVSEDRGPDSGARVASALTLGGLYAGFTTWTYFAWYRKHKPLRDFAWGGDGWFGARTYAGGADKLGHAWATMGLARIGTEMLHQWGGYSKLTSTLIGTALSEALFLGVEVKDGFYYEFSFSDATFDTLGAALAVALSLSPRLDELFDFRVEYWPSHEYRKQFDGGNVNVAEDYSGETYLLALHLGGIHALRDASWGGWSRFVDVALGFGTRGYKPDPPKGEIDPPHRQELSIGVTLNLQGVADWLFEGRSRPARKIGHALFEVFNFGYVPVFEHRRHPDGMVNMDGA
jgi:hypothetical protein